MNKIKSKMSLRSRLLLSGVTSVALTGGAYGQVQATSPSQQPPGELAGDLTNETVFSLPQVRGVTAPNGAEDTRFVLGNILLEGGQDSLNARALQAAPQAGINLTIEELFEYAGLVQQLYLEAGYPLARVIVPAQDIQPEGGDFRIQIVNGYIDRIDTSALSEKVSGQVKKMLSPLVGNDTVTAAELERRVLLAGETNGVTLRTALTPGEDIGSATLVVTGGYRAVQAVLSVDNRIIEDAGREQATLSAAFNSVLGMGEQVVLTTATALNEPGLGPSALRSYVGISASAPVGVNGWSVGVQAIQASNSPDPVSPGVQFESEFFRTGISASYALRRARKRSTSLTLGFDASFEEQRLDLLANDVSLFADRTRVARIELSGYEIMGGGTSFSYDAQLSRGLNALGARTASDASTVRPLSRDGAEADFTKLSVEAVVHQNLSNTLNLQANLRAQSSFNAPLLRSEQISFVSANLVSGPPSGLVTGDRMVAARVEAQSNVRMNDSIRVQPYIAIAGGESHLERATVLERKHSGASSAGIGFRSQYQIAGNARLDVQLEWASVQSKDSHLERDWTGFSVALRY